MDVTANPRWASLHSPISRSHCSVHIDPDTLASIAHESRFWK